MAIDVRGPDGTVYRVNTDDEQEARETVRRYLAGDRPQRNMPRSSNPQGRRPDAQSVAPRVPAPQAYPSWRARGVEDVIRGTPSQGYRRAYERRVAERAPRGQPGTFLRRLEDFNRGGPSEMLNQMVRNIGVADDAAYWANRINGVDAARAASDYERDRQQQVTQQQPILNAASIAASVPAFGGTPAAVAPRLNALQAGGVAAGLNAPFALARQEGDLQERLPGAAEETAAAGLFGAGLQAAINRLARPALSNTTAARAQEFENVNVPGRTGGVRAPLAAVQARGNAPMAMAIAENPIGGNVRRNLQNSVDDVEAAARGLTGRTGTPEPREIAGETVQRGVRRFAGGRNEPKPSQAAARTISTRDWSFGAKSSALYDDVFSRLAADEQAMIAGQVQGPFLTTSATQRTIGQILNRVSGAASREAMASPMVRQIQQALTDDLANGTLRFQDLRAWRTWVREAQRNEGLRQGLDNAALQRLEAALTEDIYASAMMIGGQAADDLRAIDRWYRRITQRINTALQPFDNANGGAQAYRRIVDLASQGGRQNTRALEQLRASLRPDEWRTVAATVMDDLGRPRFGAPNAMEPGAFSLEHFVTNVARLSPSGRRVLFGPQLASELENLARVAGYVKGVRGFANYSRSGSSIQNMSTLTAVGGAAVAAGTGNFMPLAMLAGAGLLARITGEMLTNPAFVRWLTSPGGGGMKRQLAALATIAARDPAVAPLYGELAQRGADHFRAPSDQPPERRELVQ